MVKKEIIELKDDRYISIKIEDLILDLPIPFNVYLKDNGVMRLAFVKGSFFSKEAKRILDEKGFTALLISDKDLNVFNEYISKKRPKEEEKEFDLKKYSLQKDLYFQIEKDLLLQGSELNFPLYVWDFLSYKEIFNASETYPHVLNKELKYIDSDIYIKAKDIALYRSYINKILERERDNPNLKAIAIRENSKIVVKELLDDPRSGKKIKEVEGLVDKIIDSILERDDAIYNLLSLQCYDYYTYTHSVNVCTLSVGLGLKIDLKKDDIKNLGIGSMLHDVGKSSISKEILNKQGMLNDKEYRIIKNHVLEGEKILRSHKNIPEDSFYAVLQHHEKLSGKGYPLGLRAKDISLFGKITAIADCYDALTTQRPYKKAFTPYYALFVIVKETEDYDPELLKTFIKMLGNIR